MTYLCWLLMWFEACSKLRINVEKSELIPVGSGQYRQFDRGDGL